MTTYPDLQSAGIELATRLKQRYNAHDHPHPAEKTLSVSSLVDKPASVIAQKMADYIHRGVWDEGDDYFMGKPLREYTFLGDNLADAAFCKEDQWNPGEMRCELDMGDGWVMRGHPDAWCLTNVAFDTTGPVPYLWFGEHKAHAEITARKEEKMKRQNILNLAIAWNAVREGEIAFDYAEWSPLYGQQWYWPEGARPAGSITGICSWFGSNPTDAMPMSEVQLDEILHYYHTKGAAIIKSAMADDMSFATEWDNSNSEFEGDALDGIPQGELDDLAAKWHEAKDFRKQAEEAEKKAKAAVEAHLKALGAWEQFIEDGKLTVCDDKLTIKNVQYNGRKSADVKALQEAGLTQYIKEGKPYSVFSVA